MLIFERSVTTPYKIALYEYLYRRIKAKKFEYINAQVIVIRGGSCTLSYVILDNDKPIAWLYLSKRPNWAAWEVKQVFVSYEFRCQGLATKIYKAAIIEHGILLASGKTQTKYSRVLWQKFIQQNLFNIWAQDFNNLSNRGGVEFYDDELFCALPIYQLIPDKHDVRLLAMRK
jgi:GNAT superfamily N-acetyltransferase